MLGEKTMAASFDRTIWRAWRILDGGFSIFKRFLRIGFLVYFGWSFYDLFASPALKQAVNDARRGNQPIQKTTEEIRIGEEQQHCRHLYQIRGLWNFFCPLCGKKLLEGDPPWWQIWCAVFVL